MFNAIKAILGLSSCRGCRYTRLGGLYCGCPRPEHALLHRAWRRLGCLFYANTHWYDNHGNRHKVRTTED